MIMNERSLILKIPEIEQRAAGADFALCGGQNDDFPSEGWHFNTVAELVCGCLHHRPAPEN